MIDTSTSILTVFGTIIVLAASLLVIYLTDRWLRSREDPDRPLVLYPNWTTSELWQLTGDLQLEATRIRKDVESRTATGSWSEITPAELDRLEKIADDYNEIVAELGRREREEADRVRRVHEAQRKIGEAP